MDEWACEDGSCIPVIMRCDGSVQCGDLSDETSCEQSGGCLEGERLCRDSEPWCIPETRWCDGVVDCRDMSDESNCRPS